MANIKLLKEAIDKSIIKIKDNDGRYEPDGTFDPRVMPFGDLSKIPASKAHAHTLASTRFEIAYYQGIAHMATTLNEDSILKFDVNHRQLFEEQNFNRSRVLMLDAYDRLPKPPKGFSLSGITSIAVVNASKNRQRVNDVIAPVHERYLLWDVKRDTTGRSAYRAGEALIYFWNNLFDNFDDMFTLDAP